MNKIFSLLLFVSFFASAQSFRPFVEVGYNRQFLFFNNSYYNIGTGLELNLKNYVKPEIELNYFLGGFDDEINYNEQGAAITVFNRKFSVINFGFSPKILLFNNKEDFYYFQLLPKYNFSIIEAKGDYLLINQNDTTKSIREKESIKENKQSFGLGLGIVFNFSKIKKAAAIAVNLFYQNIDAGSLMTKLKHNNLSINTKDVFSLEFVYYINLNKK